MKEKIGWRHINYCHFLYRDFLELQHIFLYRHCHLPVLNRMRYIRNINQLEKAYKAGADLVVIGTAFENGEFET